MTQSLNEVKQSAAESVQKVKERLGLKEKEDPLVRPGSGKNNLDRPAGGAGTGGGASPRQEGIKAIQDENAELHKAVREWEGDTVGIWEGGRKVIRRGQGQESAECTSG